MAAGDSTVQQVLDAVAEQVATVPGIEAAYSSEIRQIQKLPCVIFSWFSDIDTTINTGSDQLWTVAASIPR